MSKERLIEMATETASRSIAVFVGVLFAGVLFWGAAEIRIEIARQRLQAQLNQNIQDAFQKKLQKDFAK